MVSALNSGSGSLGLSPGRGTVLCSWARQFALTVPLFSQVYNWVPVNLLLGFTLQWTSIPSRVGEGQKYSQLLHAAETGISSGLLGQRQFFYLAYTRDKLHKSFCLICTGSVGPSFFKGSFLSQTVWHSIITPQTQIEGVDIQHLVMKVYCVHLLEAHVGGRERGVGNKHCSWVSVEDCHLMECRVK